MIKTIELLKAQNEGLKKQNMELQATVLRLTKLVFKMMEKGCKIDDVE